MRKGFTLLEVLIVVIIIGILAAIAMPQYVGTIEKARSAEAASNIGSLRTSVDRYWYEQASQATYTAATMNILDVDNPNSITGRLFNYTLTDASDASGRNYTIRAERTNNAATYWLLWIQASNTSGRLYKATALGGPES